MRSRAVIVTWVALLGGAVDLARAECKPAALPVGDPVLVQSLTERLTASGIVTTPSDGCPAVHVQVEQRGAQLLLRVIDSYQRHGERSVQDVATAAAIIESWTLQEIEEGSLPPDDGPIDVTSARVATSSTHRARTAIGLGARSVVQNDASTWVGGALAGCARVGALCLGGSLAVLADTSTTSDATRGTQRSKEVDALATVDLPLRAGRFVVSPGVGLGYGWQTFAQQHTDAHALPMSIEQTSHALRGEVHVGFALPLGRVALFTEIFGDVSLARTEIPAGPTTAPRARAGLSLGLRFEVP